MDSKETHQQQQNRNAAASAAPTSTSQAMHNRSSAQLSPRQPQPQQARTLDASPNYVGIEQGGRGRGRGRPRKYAPPDVVVIDGGDSGGGAKRKGPPLGSRDALGGGEGRPLTTHVININAGENIAAKLVAFMNQEPRNVCILSASGAVSSVVLQTINPIGVFEFKGRFVIISMSGMFLKTESNATVAKTDNLKVSLAGPDLMVLGGHLGGNIVAASQVQVVVGTFEPERVELSAASSAQANALSSSGGGGSGLPQSLGNSTPHHLPLLPGNNPQ